MRKAKVHQKGDERILGDGDFVQNVLSEAKEAYEKKHRLLAKGLDLEYLADKASKLIGIEPNIVRSKGKHPKVVQARSLLCYWATNELGVTQSALSKRLGVVPSTVSYCVARGRELVEKY